MPGRGAGIDSALAISGKLRGYFASALVRTCRRQQPPSRRTRRIVWSVGAAQKTRQAEMPVVGAMPGCAGLMPGADPAVATGRAPWRRSVWLGNARAGARSNQQAVMQTGFQPWAFEPLSRRLPWRRRRARDSGLAAANLRAAMEFDEESGTVL